MMGPLTACSWKSRSFFSLTKENCLAFSSSLWDPEFSRVFLQLTHSSFRAAISSPIPADSTRGLILKKSLIQGQVFTVMKTLRFHWITRRVSLNQERKEKQVTPDNGRAIFPIKILKKHIFWGVIKVSHLSSKPFYIWALTWFWQKPYEGLLELAILWARCPQNIPTANILAMRAELERG